MLTSDQIEALCLQELVGKPSGVKGKEADDFLVALRKDVKIANDNNWTIELPFEVPNLDEVNSAISELMQGDDGWEYYTEESDRSPGYEIYRSNGSKVQRFDWNAWSFKDA